MRTLKLLLFAMFVLLIASPVYAQTGGAAAPAATNWVAITSGFSLAIAAGLAALGQGRVAGSAAEAMARNPGARAGIQLALILGLAFIESLVLFTLVIVFVKVV